MTAEEDDIMVNELETGRVGAQCSHCHAAMVGPDGPLSWSSRTEALHTLAGHGWARVDGVLLCARCARTTECARLGHPFGSWVDDEPSGMATRACRGCGTVEHAPAYVRRPVRAGANGAPAA